MFLTSDTLHQRSTKNVTDENDDYIKTLILWFCHLWCKWEI